MKQVAIPGIIGGLGPLAHIEFERQLLQESVRRGATCDQDHPVWLLVNAADVPDRTASLMGQVEDCTPCLLKYGQQLEASGASFLIVTCNTAHAFYEQIQPQLAIPWLHMMTCTARWISTSLPGIERVGILATDGTLQKNLYGASLRQMGLTPITPAISSLVQTQIMNAIYHPAWGIKAAGCRVPEAASSTLAKAIAWFKAQGAELVIAGCTELSIGLASINNPSLPWVDPLQIMAAITLDLSYGVCQLQSVQAA